MKVPPITKGDLRTLSGEALGSRSKYDPLFSRMRELKPGVCMSVQVNSEDHARAIIGSVGHAAYKDKRKSPAGYRFSYRVVAKTATSPASLVIGLKPVKRRK